MNTIYYGDTNIGNVRSNNEDSFVLKEVWEGTHLLAAVVDGVGGNGGGDVASDIAARCICEHFSKCVYSDKSLDILQSAVIFANNSIHAQHYNPWLSEMSCVLTVALINLETGQVDICHVGDTRMYKLNNGVLTRITRDHSLIGPLEESGQITELEAMTHSHRNYITRSIGKNILQLGTEYIQTHTIKLKPNTTHLLCSDGLYDMVHSLQTKKILSESISVNQRVDKLISAALEAGGRDNVTVIIVDIIE